MSDKTLFRQKAPGVMRSLMRDFELDEVQAAGILGNLGHECAGFRIMHEIGQPEGKGGYGWAQWTGARRRAFFQWCDRHRLEWTSDAANYGYLKHELDGPEHNAIGAVEKTRTLPEAVRAFERNFERAGVPRLPSRDRWAQAALDAYRH